MTVKLKHAGVDDVAQALVDVLTMILDVEFAAADKRTVGVSRRDMFAHAAQLAIDRRAEGSLSNQLMEFIVSGNKKPRLTIVPSTTRQ